MKVHISRQVNDWKIGTVDFSSLGGFKWDYISGGIQSLAPQPFIHAYVWCVAIEGDFSHYMCPDGILSPNKGVK